MTKIMKFIGSTPIPSQVQHINGAEDYIVGSGLVVAGGDINGRWNFVAGPHYTCSNYIKSEEIRLEINGIEHIINFNFHRARETGIYYGVSSVEDIDIYLIDYTCWGSSHISRLMLVENKSADKKYTIAVKAYINVMPDESGIKNCILTDLEGCNRGIGLNQDKSLYSLFGTRSGWIPNWTERNLLIAFNQSTESVLKEKETYIMKSSDKSLHAGEMFHIALCHYMYDSNTGQGNCVDLINSIDVIKDAERCISQWQNWFRGVSPKFSLDRINDQRAKDIVEGGLAVIKTNQTVDGGIVANERWYSLSWTRDTYCGLRGLLSFGHTEESKRFIEFTHHKYLAHGFIPNAVSCGSDSFALYNGNSQNTPLRHLGGPCPEANTAPETPALYILAARDYYEATNDLNTLMDVHVSLKYSMDIQLKHAINNGYRLEFSGDETELCGAVSTNEAGFDRHLEKYWSMSSVALCIASLEFYIEYIKKVGENPGSYISVEGTIYNLNLELENLREAIERDFWRNDLEEYPEGFHEWCRIKVDNSFPAGRIVNFTLFPVYYGANLKYTDRLTCDVNAIKKYYDTWKKSIPLVPAIGDGRYLGHNLGYLLWCLIQINDPLKEIVYDALINGKTVQCWGTYNEAYDADGTQNDNTLRTFETGVNISAVAKYWNIGF